MFLSVLSDLVTSCSYKFKGVFKKLHVTIRTYFTRLERDFFGDMGEGCYCKNGEKGKKTTRKFLISRKLHDLKVFALGGAVFRWLEVFI